jgi:SNF2 family DNA or RNA helicase
LEAQLTVVYGDSPLVPPGHGKVKNLPRLVDDHCEVRDFTAEEYAVTRLKEAGFQCTDAPNGCWELHGESSILNFLTRVLPQLRDAWRITEGTRFRHVSQHVTLVSPRIEILGSGEDWLGFDLTFHTTDGTVFPAAEARQLLRSGRTTAKLSDGRRLVISDDLAELIDPLFNELELQQKGGHFEASARSGEVVLEISKKLRNSKIYNHLNEIKTFVPPAALRADLRPYQRQGAAWLLERVERFGGALLADDMGLGKTLQAIALIECLFSKPPSDSGLVLVVATTSLLGNWQAEIGRFAPGRRVRILHGAGRDAERERLQSGEVILTSYGTLARDLAWHLQRDYLAVVVDEASLMRNPDTDYAKAVAKLRASARIALTGTPVENSVRDLWSVFRFIQPGWLGGREEFRERYELPIAEGESARAVMERLKLKTQPFLLRRTKEQVAPELPSKLFIDEFCDLSPDQQTVYRELLVEGRKQVDAIADSGNPGAARMQMLTALLRLRQTCCDLALLGNGRFNRLLVARRSAKLQRLLELLDEAVNGNHRVLVFSQFQKQLLEIEKCVLERGWGCLRLDGQTRSRQQMVETFQDPQGPPVFLISLKAGGYGLNLTAADTVIHFDPWWNPAAEMQATDRAHRIGQTRPVTVYRLLTRGTVEEKVVRLQARKRELAASIDETGAGNAPGWTMEDFKAVMEDG